MTFHRFVSLGYYKGGWWELLQHVEKFHAHILNPKNNALEIIQKAYIQHSFLFALLFPQRLLSRFEKASIYERERERALCAF